MRVRRPVKVAFSRSPPAEATGACPIVRSQQATRNHLEARGFACTDSVDRAIKWLKGNGILRGGIKVR